eukprot:9476540-Pyramimonas_sp.AAC.1
MSLGKLTYFPVMAKGLQLALLAEFSGLEWDGEQKTRGDGPRDWPQLKSETPFGQMPFLVTPEGLSIGQSVAIANYIGRKGDMLGKTDADFAISQMCMAEGESLNLKIETQTYKGALLSVREGLLLANRMF